MKDYELAPCITCGKCPVSKGHWGKGVISISCNDACVKWNKWFPDGWNAVCAPFRKLKAQRDKEGGNHG